MKINQEDVMSIAFFGRVRVWPAKPPEAPAANQRLRNRHAIWKRQFDWLGNLLADLD